MVIEINKDIESYQESVVMGLSGKQFLFSIASVLVGGTLIVFLHPYVGLTLAVYIAIPAVAPIALGGFYTFNGMNFYEYVKRKIHFAFFNRAYGYESTEREEPKARKQKRGRKEEKANGVI